MHLARLGLVGIGERDQSKDKERRGDQPEGGPRHLAAALQFADHEQRDQHPEHQHQRHGAEATPAELHRQPHQRQRGEAHRDRHDPPETLHPRAGLGQHSPQRRHKAEQQERQRQPQPEQAEQQQRLRHRQQQRRAQRRRHERPGARGRHECREQPGGKGPGLLAAHADTDRGQFEQPGEVGRDCGGQHQQSDDDPRLLQLESPADLLARRPQGQQRRAERHAGEHHACGIGQPLAARLGLAFAGAGERDRLEAQDREDAGHDVEEEPAEQRAQHQRPDRRRGNLVRPRHLLAPGGHRAQIGGKAHPASVPESEDAGQRLGLARPELVERDLGDQQVTLAPEGLRGGIGDELLVGDKHIGIGKPDTLGQRDRHPQRLARNGESRAGIEQGRDRCPPAREITARRSGQPRELRHADLVGAGEVIDRAPDRPGEALDARPRDDRHQHGIGAFIDVVHQPGDQQPLGHRIARLTHFPVRRQAEVEHHPCPRIARVRPIAVPLGPLGLEMERQQPFLALGRLAFGVERHRDIVRPDQRIGRGALLRLSGRTKQRDACDKRKQPCTELTDQLGEDSCVRHGLPSRLGRPHSQSEPPR